ncbi:hypothetical protein F5B20DRAFT_482243 [Whalleya microplaca]|nr:hypothetical protein F5B20DRAFT_482243 [Whalleya microplaca]
MQPEEGEGESLPTHNFDSGRHYRFPAPENTEDVAASAASVSVSASALDADYDQHHDNHHHHHHHHHHLNSRYNHDEDHGYDHPLPSPLSYADNFQFPSYAISNFQAAHENATSAAVEVDPHDFYRTYPYQTGIDLHIDAHDELMASALPVSRQNQNAPARSNGNATSPKHAMVSSTRPGLQALRSVSAPVDDRTAAGAAKARPAASKSNHGNGNGGRVKDLTKRFDQNGTQLSNTNARKPSPRIPTRETSSNGHTSYTALRSSTARDFATTAPSTRNRAVAEDHVSNNSQSFASRIAKPRTGGSGHSQASKSLSNLSPIVSPRSTPQPQSRSLLFGEIVPGQIDAGTAGYGIAGVRRQRSLSHPDAEPPSPSDWYRGAEGESAVQDDAEPHSPVKTAKAHSRSLSDAAGIRPNPVRSKASPSSRAKPQLSLATPTTSSRLPVSVRKFNSPSASSSPSSTRASSPSTRSRPAVQGKVSTSIPTPRAKTPISNSSSAAKRPNRLGAVTPNDSTRLNAYISTPAPKLSPTLRSSRPRQPVSSATTTSSRMKAVERGKSPSKFESRMAAKANEQGTRRRKISMGPIDFESRREQIKLSYTKSIRESEARAAIRRAAEEKKRKAEAEAAARRQAEAEAEAEAIRAEIAAEERRQEEARREELTADSVQSPGNTEISAAEQAALSISTDLSKPNIDALVPKPGVVQKDSPTLGIPGSFPSIESPNDQEEAPPSAISNTTEFDVEPQTDPPLQEIPLRADMPTIKSVEEQARLAHSSSEYRSPFEDESPNDDSVSIKISLDTSVETKSQSLKPSLVAGEPSTNNFIPSSYQDDEYEPQPLPSQTYQTKVTIIGRDSDFSPPARESSEPTYAGYLQAQDGSRERASHIQLKRPPNLSRNYSYGSGAPNDEQPDPSAGLSDIEEFFVGPIIKDALAERAPDSASNPPKREPIAAADQPIEEIRFSIDSRRTMGTAPSLTVPRTSDSMNRASQTTVWTDYSINSQDAYSDYGPKDRYLQNRDSAYIDDQSISESCSRPQSYHYDIGSRDASPSPKTRLEGSFQDIDSLHEQPHQLPELNTGGGFVVDYLPHKSTTTLSTIPTIPDHAPPPPPADKISLQDIPSSAPQSEYFDDTRPSSYLHISKDDQSLFSIDPSRRESEDFSQSESGHRTVYQGSLEISEGTPQSTLMSSQQTLAESIDQTQDAAELPEKERKRLFTRLETIKELIDTEAFFVRDMNIVEEIYKGTAEACPQLDDKTIKLIFRNTDQIIKFHSSFLVELKEAVSSVYTPKAHRTQFPKENPNPSDGTSPSTTSTPATSRLSDDRDRETSLGPVFIQNMEKMKAAHETFLKNSDHAAKRLIQIQEDPTVKVWLNECNEVARDLTKAWNLDSLLIKPMQRITKYPNLLIQLLHETPATHPDRPALESAKVDLENAIEEINKTKKNFELVGQIVGRKRKDSDVRAGFARAFGKKVDKLQTGTNRPPEDPEYLKLHEKFGDDYLRLQVVLRDVEFYTRQVTEYVHEFLQYLSSMELVMRLQPSPHPEIESKWVRFNVSMRDIEKVALEQHLSQVRKQVIEPFELVIKSYGNPSLAMKKRGKRRLDYEKSIQLKKSGKKVDKQLAEFIEQYEALNEALKKELPKLSTLTEKVGKICLANFVTIQTQWYAIWKEKVKVVLGDPQVPEISDIVSVFQHDYKFQDEQINTIGIVNSASVGRPSQSTSTDESFARLRLRPSESYRGRGLSLSSDAAPTLPAPDWMKRHSGQFTLSPSGASAPSPQQYYRDYYAGVNTQGRPGSSSPHTPDLSGASRSIGSASIRPGTGQSFDSSGAPRQSMDSGAHSRPYSSSMYPSPYQPQENQRFSGLFQSALPPTEGQERLPRPSQASSRASSRERQPINGYNVLWLAASLFEFNIETTKHEAGYPYLTYQAGEVCKS